MTVIDIDGKQATRYENFCGSNPVFAKKLRSWGEAGVVKTRSWFTPKIADRATVCIMFGYFSKAMAAHVSRPKKPTYKPTYVRKNVPEATRKKIYMASNGQ